MDITLAVVANKLVVSSIAKGVRKAGSLAVSRATDVLGLSTGNDRLQAALRAEQEEQVELFCDVLQLSRCNSVHHWSQRLPHERS